MLFRSLPRVSLTLASVLVTSALATGTAVAEDFFDSDKLPNNFPFLNQAGTAATYSPVGFIDLKNEFHLEQGTNGRTCESGHLPHAGWSIRPADVEFLFLLSRGTDSLFNVLDANSAKADVSTVKARYASYSMLRKGLFRRGGDVPANAQYEIVA